jgi:serine/threonine protein kinase
MELNACGTAGYIAPEMFSESFDYKADVFSAGATLFKMLTKRSLFKGKPHSNLVNLTIMFDVESIHPSVK